MCRGNICRSPYAAQAFLRDIPPRLQARTRITSAGFLGPDRPPPSEAIQVATSRGVQLHEHRSQLLTRQDVDTAELVVVMDAAQQAAIHHRFGCGPDRVLVLGDLDPEPIATRAIRDPIFQSQQVFHDSYERIDRCIGVLVRILGAQASQLPSATEPRRSRPAEMAPEQPS